MKKIIVLLVLICMTASAWAALPRVELLPMRDLRMSVNVSTVKGLFSWERDGKTTADVRSSLTHTYESKNDMIELDWSSFNTVSLVADLDDFSMSDLIDSYSVFHDVTVMTFPLAGSPLLGFGGNLLAAIFDYGDTGLFAGVAPRVQFGRIYDASRHVKAYLAADLMDRPNADLRYVINQMSQEGEYMKPLSWRTDMDYYRNIYRGFGGAVEPISVKYAFDSVVDTKNIGRGMSVSIYPEIYLIKVFDGTPIEGEINLTLAEFELKGSFASSLWYHNKTKLYNSFEDLFDGFFSRWIELDTYHLSQNMGLTWFAMPLLRIDQSLGLDFQKPFANDRETEIELKTDVSYRLSPLATAWFSLSVISEDETSKLFEIDRVQADIGLSFRIL